MALDGNALGLAIKNALESGGYLLPDEEGGDNAGVLEVWQVIGNTLVNYLTTNTVVNAGQTVATPDTINGTVTSPGTIS